MTTPICAVSQGQSPRPLVFLPGQRLQISQRARFLAKVKVAANGCLLWTAAQDGRGYGLMKVAGRRLMRRTHRLSYQLFNGAIPDGLDLDHACHNRDETCVGGIGCVHRSCVNPFHLVPVTNQANLLLGRTIPALHASKTHCVRNHPLSGPDANVYMTAKGGRQCRPCKVIAAQERAEMLRAGVVVDRRRNAASVLALAANASFGGQG